MVAKVLVKHLQDVGLGAVLAIQGVLVSDETVKTLGQGTFEIRNGHSASPSPMATSRRVSIATFVYTSVD